MPVALALPGWGTSTDRLQPITSALQDRGIKADAWAYDAVGSIRSIGGALAERVAGLDEEVHLVGHSLGGLVCASAVLHHDASVASVTTINAPWRGTWAAWTAHPGDPLGRELRWGAAALADLRQRLDDHLRSAGGPAWTIASAAGDLAVPITGSLRVPTGDRLETVAVPVGGHSVSLLHDRMVDVVAERVVGART